ncbi:MAG TPA: D-aminopeptidase [Caulobacteraceae bacterium]|nr:D-aminopeptidase [Caulobacteraceae bacterium]
MADRLDAVLEALPRRYPGPGGAVAVVRRGEVRVRHAWGWANAERRIPFSPKTLFRICSITKQFTCAALLDAFPDPSVLDGEVASRLPRLEEPAPSALRLAHNQSGLRDYWAVAMLCGAPPESAFGAGEARRLIGATRALQFPPGARYSYANQNFRILSDILEAREGRDFGEVLRARIFDPAGMETAVLAADTRALPDGTQGYEAMQQGGFRAAENRIVWTGDAGIAASLDDMIAWERWIDATREDDASLYRRLSAPVTFADGAPALYGFGLGRGTALGRAVTEHGGGLWGWRSHRMYAPAERLSIVVLFNHLSDAHEAAVDLFAAALGEDRPAPPPALPPPDWLGAYLEPETGLSVRIEAAEAGKVRLRYGYPPASLDLTEDGAASAGGTRLRYENGGLSMDRPGDNQSTLLAPRSGPAATHIAGRWRCAELDAELTIADAGGVLWGAFSGFLGQGPMERLDPVGPDLWVLPCLRALDYTPPGDWTLAFRRDPDHRPERLRLGCWLARRLDYVRVE